MKTTKKTKKQKPTDQERVILALEKIADAATAMNDRAIRAESLLYEFTETLLEISQLPHVQSKNLRTLIKNLKKK